MLSKHFEHLGFNQKEEKVYLALAEYGNAAAAQLSKLTGIPRATVYSVVESLIEKGIISREETRGTTIFFTNNPSAFVRLVEKEKEQNTRREETAKELVSLLAPYIESKEFSLPKIMFFEGKRNIESMLYDYLPAWRKSLEETDDYTLWGYQDPTFVEHYRRWHDYLWRTMGPRERIRLFSNSSDFEQELVHKIARREVRGLPQGTQFKSSIWLYGDYIVMGSTRQEPHYAFQIKNQIFAANLRTIFQLLWQAHF